MGQDFLGPIGLVHRAMMGGAGGAATRQEGERLPADLGRRPVAIGTAADPWSAGAVLLEPV
jgi:hypothetical protein